MEIRHTYAVKRKTESYLGISIYLDYRVIFPTLILPLSFSSYPYTFF